MTDEFRSLGFNTLFTEAERAGLLLNNFCQQDDGLFMCNWRRPNVAYFSPVVRGRLAFPVAWDALTLALKEIPKPKAVEPPMLAAEDLFA